jgi:hypothetical protein
MTSAECTFNGDRCWHHRRKKVVLQKLKSIDFIVVYREFMQSIQTIYLSIQHQKQQALFQPVAFLTYEKPLCPLLFSQLSQMF